MARAALPAALISLGVPLRGVATFGATVGLTVRGATICTGALGATAVAGARGVIGACRAVGACCGEAAGRATGAGRAAGAGRAVGAGFAAGTAFFSSALATDCNPAAMTKSIAVKLLEN
jgi:hypothetical protein